MEKIKKHKELIAMLIFLVILIGLLVAVGVNSGETKVKFKVINEKKMPKEITSELLPEYRELERAMACIIDEKVYVMVTRGEKPTVGYEVEIDKIKLKNEDDKSTMVVYANFADPENSENLAQVKSYPVVVVEADLTGLPDKIKLVKEYVK